jgi:pilus assembly protein Flp/PilA
MSQVLKWIQDRKSLLAHRIESGAAAVEYGLLVALIAVVIIVAVIALGGKVKCTFSNVAGNLPNASGATVTTSPGC